MKTYRCVSAATHFYKEGKFYPEVKPGHIEDEVGHVGELTKENLDPKYRTFALSFFEEVLSDTDVVDKVLAVLDRHFHRKNKNRNADKALEEIDTIIGKARTDQEIGR